MAHYHPQFQTSPCMCVTIVQHTKHILIQLGGVVKDPTQIEESSGQWEQFRESMFYRKWKWEIRVKGTVQVIVQAIQDGQALAVSDGLFKDGKGAAAWIKEGHSGQDKISGACLVLGKAEDHSTFQSELMGILGMLLMVMYMMERHGPIDGNLKLCCNGKSALSRVASMSLSTSWNHMLSYCWQ